MVSMFVFQQGFMEPKKMDPFEKKLSELKLELRPSISDLAKVLGTSQYGSQNNIAIQILESPNWKQKASEVNSALGAIESNLKVSIDQYDGTKGEKQAYLKAQIGEVHQLLDQYAKQFVKNPNKFSNLETNEKESTEWLLKDQLQKMLEKDANVKSPFAN